MKSFLCALVLSTLIALVSAQSTRRTETGGARLGGERQGAACVAPLVGEPVVRWSFGPLAFESEPLPGEEHTLVNGRDPCGRRALVVLGTETGRVLSRTLLSAAAPLAVARAGTRVAVRSAENRVDLFRLRGARLLLERSFVHASSVSAPALAGEELVLREGDELVRYDLQQSEPAWRARAPGAFFGTPIVSGDALFAGWREANGNVHLACLARASGAQRADVVLGNPRQGAGPEGAELELVAHATLVFVRLAPGLPATDGRLFDWARVPFDGASFGRATLHDFLAPPLETDSGWVAPERTRDGATRWIMIQAGAQDAPSDAGGERAIELASPEHHAWLSAAHAPASRAGAVLYLGPCAADASTLQVLWRRSAEPDFRPVPVPGGLLVIEGDRLHRLGAAPEAPQRVRAEAAERAEACERELGERLALLSARALRMGDRELAQRFAGEAEALGASGRALELVRTESERPAPLAAAPERVEPRRTALLAEERAARSDLLRALAEAAHLARDAHAKRALLGELFRRDPANASGLAELERLLPAGVDLAHAPAPVPALAWLELAALAATHPLELLGTAQAAPTRTAPTSEQVRLEEERARWRADALGYQSERLLLVTAGAAPGAVARTLRAGELVCDLLEETFGASPLAAERLELVLYPTRAEYLAHSGSDLGGLENVLGFTAGHFDLGARVSRLFLPDEDGDSARLLGVSAHELTHHWLATRSTFGPPRSARETPGFWVVEAIATWVEELRLDAERRTWATAPLRAASVDTVRAAGASELLPWRTLLSASFDDYTELETRATCMLSLDWQLGSRAPRSPMQLFYAQGGALVHYLHEAEGGRWRALLLSAVEGFYRGTPLDMATAMNASPDELGQRVIEWARSL